MKYQPDRILRRCAYPPCAELHTNDKYCSVACKVEDSKKVERREMAKCYAPVLLGPNEPLNPPWTPRPKPPQLMTDEEQIDINLQCHVRDWKRMERPLTRDMARIYGAAW